jgi:hypothetical protein
MLNFQSSGVGLSLIQTQSHIPPRSTSFSSGPSFFSASEFFSASDQELAPENYPEDYPVSTGQLAARQLPRWIQIVAIRTFIMLNSHLSNSLDKFVLLMVPQDLRILGFLFINRKSQIINRRSQIDLAEFSDLEIADRIFFCFIDRKSH